MTQRTKAPLRWEQQSSGGWFAYRGRHIVGLIAHVTGVPSDDARYGVYHWKLEAVHTKWVTKGSGDSKDVTAAKKAMNRAWHNWLEAHHLTGVDE